MYYNSHMSDFNSISLLLCLFTLSTIFKELENYNSKGFQLISVILAAIQSLKLIPFREMFCRLSRKQAPDSIIKAKEFFVFPCQRQEKGLRPTLRENCALPWNFRSSRSDGKIQEELNKHSQRRYQDSSYRVSIKNSAKVLCCQLASHSNCSHA